MDPSSAAHEISIPPTSSRLGSRRPSLHMQEGESRKRYLKEGVPLYNLALSGNWEECRIMFQRDKGMLKTAITKDWATVLHVAVAANQVHFVKELVKLMDGDDLELMDCNGNTAFFLAAGVGNCRLAKIMLYKNRDLPVIRGEKGLTPLHFAVIQGRSEMAKFLYHETEHVFEDLDWNVLFLTGINVGMYDLAMAMLQERPILATVRDRLSDTGLHLLARKKLTKSVLKNTQVLQLVRDMWTIILARNDSESAIREIIDNPSPLVFDAALIGNFEFLAELVNIYPDLLWEGDNRGQTIIHLAVEYRHVKIFNLIYERSYMKDFIIYSVDDNNNTLLHLVARLAPPDRLNVVSGAVFQLVLELIWFEEVKKIMVPSNLEARCNSDGLTPSELFTKEHKNLLRDAEQWMKSTVNSCMIVSTVIIIGVLFMAFNVPGDRNDDTEISNYLKKPAYTVFSISNGIAFISSSISIPSFLSIIMCRYTEFDVYKMLPLKLVFSLGTLFISITALMVAFISALFITYNGMKLVPIFISALAYLWISVIGYFYFPLWLDILYAGSYFRSLFRWNKAHALLGR